MSVCRVRRVCVREWGKRRGGRLPPHILADAAVVARAQYALVCCRAVSPYGGSDHHRQVLDCPLLYIVYDRSYTVRHHIFRSPVARRYCCQAFDGERRARTGRSLAARTGTMGGASMRAPRTDRSGCGRRCRDDATRSRTPADGRGRCGPVRCRAAVSPSTPPRRAVCDDRTGRGPEPERTLKLRDAPPLCRRRRPPARSDLHGARGAWCVGPHPGAAPCVAPAPAVDPRSVSFPRPGGPPFCLAAVSVSAPPSCPSRCVDGVPRSLSRPPSLSLFSSLLRLRHTLSISLSLSRPWSIRSLHSLFARRCSRPFTYAPYALQTDASAGRVTPVFSALV